MIMVTNMKKLNTKNMSDLDKTVSLYIGDKHYMAYIVSVETPEQLEIIEQQEQAEIDWGLILLVTLLLGLFLQNAYIIYQNDKRNQSIK